MLYKDVSLPVLTTVRTSKVTVKSTASLTTKQASTIGPSTAPVTWQTTTPSTSPLPVAQSTTIQQQQQTSIVSAIDQTQPIEAVGTQTTLVSAENQTQPVKAVVTADQSRTTDLQEYDVDATVTPTTTQIRLSSVTLTSASSSLSTIYTAVKNNSTTNVVDTSASDNLSPLFSTKKPEQALTVTYSALTTAANVNNHNVTSFAVDGGMTAGITSDSDDLVTTQTPTAALKPPISSVTFKLPGR